MRRTLRRLSGALLVSAVVTATLAACVPFGMPPVRTESTPLPVDVALPLVGLYSQQLAWSDCGDGLQCSTAAAPLDWAQPEGEQIELALARRPARSAEVAGSILVEPGGPGASAIDYLRSSGSHVLGDDVQKHYDIVAVDPRGVGHSSPLDCLNDQQLDDFLYDPFAGERGSASWVASAQTRYSSFAAACSARSGALAAHVDTLSVARDYDMVRALLGDSRLNYMGYSYGTLIGALYADQFPARVGRMVLDGAMDPSATAFDVSLGQAVGFERALTKYLEDCVRQSSCPFAGDAQSARHQVAALLASVDQNPVVNSDGRELTGPTLLTAIVYGLYRSSSWPALSAMFQDVRSGSARQAFGLADAYSDRSSAGRYRSNLMEAFAVVSCLDYPYTTDPAVIAAQNAKLISAAPTIGPWWTFGDLNCATWPYPPTRQPAEVKAAGSAPILVIGTTGDPATPYQWAESLAGQLENGHLLTYEGVVHTAYGVSPCVRVIVDSYLTGGDLPDRGARC